MARPTKQAQSNFRLTQVREIVECLSGKHVKRVSFDGIDIEFDTAVAAMEAHQAKMEAAHQAEVTRKPKLEDLLGTSVDEEDPDLFYSAE